MKKHHRPAPLFTNNSRKKNAESKEAAQKPTSLLLGRVAQSSTYLMIDRINNLAEYCG